MIKTFEQAKTNQRIAKRRQGVLRMTQGTLKRTPEQTYAKSDTMGAEYETMKINKSRLGAILTWLGYAFLFGGAVVGLISDFCPSARFESVSAGLFLVVVNMQATKNRNLIRYIRSKEHDLKIQIITASEATENEC